MVEQHIRYLAELRLGDRFDVHVGIAERTAKALHAVSFVVDHGRERVACILEIAYLHVSMDTRRAVAIPEDVAAELDTEIATTPWLLETATGLSLTRRT